MHYNFNTFDDDILNSNSLPNMDRSVISIGLVEQNSESDNLVDLSNNFIFQENFEPPELIQFSSIYFSNQLITSSNSEKRNYELSNHKVSSKKVVFKVIPALLEENDILIIFKNSNIDSNKRIILFKVFDILDSKIDKIKNELSDKIRQKRQKKIIKRKISNISPIEKGRKKKYDFSIRFHNKYVGDNIMNKIRNNFTKYLIKYINKLIDNIYNISEKKHILNIEINKKKAKKIIKNIDYKTVSHKIRIKKNLDLLKLTIKQFLELKMSSGRNKCNLTEKYDNVKIIEKLLNDENNKDLFYFLFNEITILDWLDIYTYKKEFNDFFLFNLLNEEKKRLLNNCLVRIDKTIVSMYNKEEFIYLHCFILLIYNFKRYYSLKYERAPKSKKIKNKNE